MMALIGIRTQSPTSNFVPSGKVNGFNAVCRVLSVATENQTKSLLLKKNSKFRAGLGRKRPE